jgi:hypothetical protein
VVYQVRRFFSKLLPDNESRGLLGRGYDPVGATPRKAAWDRRTKILAVGGATP